MRPSRIGPGTAAAGLVVANVIPLVGVLGFGWDLHSLLVVYWLESGVVGTAFIAKIRRAEGEDDPEELPSVNLNDTPIASFIGWRSRHLVAFFLFHYGTFWIVHGVFVFVFPSMFPGLEPAAPGIVGIGTVGLLAYHVLSYWINYVGQREYERSGPVTLMLEPYRRVLVLHLTIVVGAFAIAAIGAPVGALVVMVLVKTALDLRGHWREHARARHRSPPTTPTE